MRIGQSAKDPALAFLKKRELQSAVNVWKAEEKRSNDHGVSKHNLAVIAHMTALDQEHRYKKKKVHEDASQKLAQFWRHAFKRWSILINEEAFWSRLAERVREFNDPRLTRGTVERIRESLPPALLSINVSLAVSSAEHDRLSEAQRQKSIVASSGFNSSVADQALVSRGSTLPRPPETIAPKRQDRFGVGQRTCRRGMSAIARRDGADSEGRGSAAARGQSHKRSRT